MQILTEKKPLVEVVRMREADIEAAIKILIENNLENWDYKDFLAEIKRHDSIILTAKTQTNVVGFCISRLIRVSNIPTEISKINNENQIKFNSVSDSELKNKNRNAGIEDLENGTECEIYNIAVKRELQHGGIGTIILNNLIKLSANFSCRAIWLEVRESNQKAISFYQKHEFKVMYKRKNFYSNPLENAIVMKKLL